MNTRYDKWLEASLLALVALAVGLVLFALLYSIVLYHAAVLLYFGLIALVCLMRLGIWLWDQRAKRPQK